MDTSHLTASTCQTEVLNFRVPEEVSIMNIKRIGLDLAKNIFQIHAVDHHVGKTKPEYRDGGAGEQECPHSVGDTEPGRRLPWVTGRRLTGGL